MVFPQCPTVKRSARNSGAAIAGRVCYTTAISAAALGHLGAAHKRGSGAKTARSREEFRKSNRFLSVGRKVTDGLSHPLFEERFVTVVGGFALGYLTAVLLHGRINAYFDTRPGPFQITKPPQGEQHSRGFVQSTVLKTITEHPQGMTTAEIITELRPQGIGQESIANALDVLVHAKKISFPGREGKYLPAASEVPTAPDQPSP
jgi:hypothetical protein